MILEKGKTYNVWHAGSTTTAIYLETVERGFKRKMKHYLFRKVSSGRQIELKSMHHIREIAVKEPSPKLPNPPDSAYRVVAMPNMPNILVVRDMYFAWSSDGQLMSGFKPHDSYRDTVFINCDFHPNIWEHVKFSHCLFIECLGIEDTNLDQWDSCLSLDFKYLGLKLVTM